MNCQEEGMLELYIPIVKSLIEMDDGSYELEIVDDERFDQCGDENEDGVDDDIALDGCGMEGIPEPELEQTRMGFMNKDVMHYRLEEYRDEYDEYPNQPCGQQQNRQDYRGKENWNGRPPQRQQNQGRGDRFSEESDGCVEDRNDCKMDDREPRGSKELETYTMKKFTICELLKARQKNKKTRKAIQTLMDLKQTMGNRMNGSFFQRGGHGQNQGRQIEYGAQGGARGGRGGGNNPCQTGKGKKELKDDYETFAMSLVPELKKLDDQQMRQFKWKVFQLIDEISADSDSGSGVNEKRGGQQQGNQMHRHGSDHSGSGMLYNECGQDQTTDQLQMNQCDDENEQWSDQESSQRNQQQRGPCQQPRQQPRQQNRQQQYQAQRQQPYQQRQKYDQCEPQQPRQGPYGQRAPPPRQYCNPSYQQREPPSRQHCDQQTRQQHCNQEQPRQQRRQQHCDQQQTQYSHCQQPQSHQPQCQPQPQHCEPKPSCPPCEPQQKRQSDSKNQQQRKDDRKTSEKRSSEDSEDTYYSARESHRSSDQTYYDSRSPSPPPKENQKRGKKVSYQN